MYLIVFFFVCIKAQDGIPASDHSIVKNDAKPQILTFDIPLNDTSSAGLGITLKGKTSIVDGQTIDLGIFIKSILTGGAASRVCFDEFYDLIDQCLSL